MYDVQGRFRSNCAREILEINGVPYRLFPWTLEFNEEEDINGAFSLIDKNNYND